MRSFVLLASFGLVTYAAQYAVADATTGDLVVSTDPPGAEVYIDGEKVGVAPLKKALIPGDHLVEARWASAKASQIVKVAQGHSAVASLQQPAGTPTAQPPPPATTGTTSAPPPTPPPEPTAVAEKPRGADALVDTAPSVAVARIEGDVLSPAHPHQRLPWGFGGGIGFVCNGTKLDVGGGSKRDLSGCGFVLHLVPWDYSFVEMNIDVLLGGAGPVGLDGGFAIGSPWFHLGSASSPVVMAIRARFAYVLQTISGANSYGGVQGGLHVEGSYALTRWMTLDAALTGGPAWTYPLACCGTGDAIGWFFQLTGGVRL